MSKIKLKNNIGSEFSIEHIDDTQAISVSSVDMSKVKSVDTINDLKALTHTPPTVWVSGYYTKGDGAFGSHIFEWDSSSTEDHNGGTVLALGAIFPTDWSDGTQVDAWFNYSTIETGRYKLRYDNDVHIKWFGAGIGNDDTIILNTILNLESNIFIDEGEYKISSTIYADITSKNITITAKKATIKQLSTGTYDTDTYMGGTNGKNGIVFNTDSSTNLIIKGLSFYTEDESDYMVGIVVKDTCNNIIIEKCKGYNFLTTFYLGNIIMNNDYESLSSIENTMVIDCFFSGGGQGQNPNGTHIVNSRKVVIESTIFEKSNGYLCRVNGGTVSTIPESFEGSANVLVQGCTFKDWNSAIGLQITKTVGVKVQGCSFSSDISLNPDNHIDLFNCFDAVIDGNTFTGGKAIWFGHADLNLSDNPDNLVGSRRCIITNNTFTDWRDTCIFIGGDGTVDGNRASHNYIISNNILEFVNVTPTTEIFIKSFLCNNIKVSDNIVKNVPIFIHTYYDKGYDINNNIIEDCPTLIDIEGEDGNTAKTHNYLNNILKGSSGSSSDFSSLNANGNILSDFQLPNSTKTNIKGSSSQYQDFIPLASDTKGYVVYKWNRSTNTTPLGLNVTIPKGSVSLDAHIHYNAAIGGGNSTACFNKAKILLFYSENTSNASTVDNGTSLQLNDSNYSSSISASVTNGSIRGP